jgi:hypothetical protein
VKARVNELHRQREPHVAQADHADCCRSICDPAKHVLFV